MLFLVAKDYPRIAHERETCTKHRTTNIVRAVLWGGPLLRKTWRLR